MTEKPFIYFSKKLKENKIDIAKLQKDINNLNDDILFCQTNILKAYKDNIINNYLEHIKDTPIHKINPDKLNLIGWLSGSNYDYVPDTKIKFDDEGKVNIRYKTNQGNWLEVK